MVFFDLIPPRFDPGSGYKQAGVGSFGAFPLIAYCVGDEASFRRG